METQTVARGPSVWFGFFLCVAGVAILLMIAYHWANYDPASTATSARQAVQQVLDEQAAAWNRGDLDGFMAGYWNSADLSYYGGDVRRGWQSVREHYRQRYPAGTKGLGTLTFSDLDIEVLAPDRAWVRGRWQLDHEGQSQSGVFTLVLRKMPEGWRIVHDHTSQSR